MKQKIILHIDFDSFFASCEQQWDCRYQNKPIGVTATNGRNCIIAASREAKKKGIKSPSRTFEAVEICPEIQFVPAHFDKYLEITKHFLRICNNFSPYIELFSLDEVFMDVTLTNRLFGGVYRLIEKLKHQIAKEIGLYITVSVGISYNKILSKMASGMKKPNGVMEINRENLDDVYRHAELTAICGIGSRIARRLNLIGIYTLLQLKTTPLPYLINEFGSVKAQFLHAVGLGLDTSSLTLYTEKPDVKSVGRNYCLAKNEYDQRIVLQNVYELSEEIGIKLRRLNKKAKTIGLSLRGTRNEYGTITRDYTSSGQDIFEVCKRLYDQWFSKVKPNPRFNRDEREYVRQISVWSGNLIDADSLTLPLFSEALRDHRLLKTIDDINEKYGDHTIRRGFLLHADKLTTVPNGWMGDRYERTKLAEESQHVY